VNARSVYLGLASAFIALAIWGSWFPFEFQPRSIAAAVRIFRDSADPRQPASLSDAVSNLLLFLPIGLLAAGAIPRPGYLAAAGIVAAGAGLSMILEFGQAFTRWRTPSVLDVGAESAGIAAGVAMWFALADELSRATRQAGAAWRAAGTAERWLCGYVAAFACAWLLPFDFTLRPDEIGDKYSHQRLLWPMTPSPDAATSIQLLVTAITAIPLGAAGLLCGNAPGERRTFPAACTLTLCVLTVLTVLQMTVFSRTTDLTVLVAAIPGVMAGAALALPARSHRRGVTRHTLQAAILLAGWLMATATIVWWPLEFDFDAARARREVASWAAAPFRITPIASMVPRLALATAAGAAIQPRVRTDYPRLLLLTAMAVSGVALLTIEGIRLLLPGATPTLLSVALEIAAFAIPFAFAVIRRRPPLRAS
jgi:glycopeptide antibiotics resistance protein